MKSLIKRNIILWLVILIPYLALVPAGLWYNKKMSDLNNASFIIINKADMTLSYYDYKGRLIQKSGVATGKNYGNKKKMGDLKTPEGVFNVVDIEDASTWKHDFKDDTLGEIAGAYGPYFIRLSVPGQKGIGIHGTHDNNSINTRASEGCIRMNNEDLTNLVKTLKPSTVVVITPSIVDVESNVIDSLKKIIQPLNNSAIPKMKKNVSDNIKESISSKNSILSTKINKNIPTTKHN